MEATMTAAITFPQVDGSLLKEIAKRFGWIVRIEQPSGLDEALEDVKAGRVYHAESVGDLMTQCLS